MKISKTKIDITSKAIKKIQYYINTQKNQNFKLRIYILGGGCNGFQYNFLFDDHTNTDDIIFSKKNVSLIVDPISFQYLYGGKIDYLENLEGSKFVVHNPHAKNTCSCGSSFSI